MVHVQRFELGEGAEIRLLALALLLCCADARREYLLLTKYCVM